MNLDLNWINAISSEIESLEPFNRTFPINDGIIDIEKYSNAKIKILWVLKEVNDKDKDGDIDGGYDSRESIKKIDVNKKGKWRSTFNPIIYTSYGILNNYIKWECIESTYHNQSVIDILKSIAIINIKKIPGSSSSNMAIIKDFYIKHKNIILQQIEAYEPDVIIGGGKTLKLLINDLSLNFIDISPIKYALKKNQLFIDTFHPNNRIIKQSEYCNSIINCVKNWQLKKYDVLN